MKCVPLSQKGAGAPLSLPESGTLSYEDYWLDYVVANKIMSGYTGAPNPGYFGSYDNITRGQVATILFRAGTGKSAQDTNKMTTVTLRDILGIPYLKGE